MKKSISLLLALLMTAALLTGCAATPAMPAATEAAEETAAAAATEAPKQDINLSFFTGKMETIDLLDQIIADYNAQSNGITVEQEFQQDASNIIKIKFASDAVPDVMTTYEKEFVDQGKYLALDDMSQWWDRLIPSMKESCTDLVSGSQYRVCTNMTMAGFFYNKQMFADLGLTPATTWEQFVSNLEAIKTAYPDVDPWFIFGEAWHLGHLLEFFPQGYIKAKYGAIAAKQAFLNNDAATLQWSNPDGALCTFARDLVDLQQKGLINADVLTATSDNCIDAFVTGKAAMFSNGMWCLSSILEKNPDMADNIGFAPYPSFMADGVPVVLVAEDSGYSIYADTPNKDAAIDFLNYLFSAENQKKYAETLGSPSAFTDVDAQWAPASVVSGVNDAVKSATNIGFTNEKPAGFSGDDAGRLVQDLLAGTYTPETFAIAFENAWNAGFKS